MMLRSCPHSSIDVSASLRFCGLMRAKVVHTSLDCSVFLTGKSCSGNLRSEQEREVTLTFVRTEGGLKLNLSKCSHSLTPTLFFITCSTASVCVCVCVCVCGGGGGGGGGGGYISSCEHDVVDK